MISKESLDPPSRDRLSSAQGEDHPASPLSSVAAIVVTHRRPRLATQVVRSLLDGEALAPNQIFVIVNGKGGLDDPEVSKSVRMVHLPHNLGPAGGFREGMRVAARDSHFEWFYLCEDDIGLFTLPERRLEYLLSNLATPATEGIIDPIGAVVAYGRDLHRLTGHTTLHEVPDADGFDRVDAACWGATLVHRRVIDAGVLPVDDYFFGYEDFDFFYRIKRAGFALLLDNRAAASVAAQMSLTGRNEAYEGKRPLDQDEPWRAFYVARNYFLLSREHGTPSWIVAHLLYSARRFQLASSTAERRAMLKGLLAGALGRRGKDERFTRSLGEAGEPSDPNVGEYDRASSVIAQPPTRSVLHVLPNDIARGGQVIARDLRDILNCEADRHEILTIFASDSIILDAEHRLPTRMGWRRKVGFDPVAYFRLRRAIARLKPDVVVAHGGEPLKYLAVMERGGAPLVYFAFGIVTDAVHAGGRHRLYEFLMNRADVVAGISYETRDEARDLFGVPNDRLALLPNSRDPSVYYPAGVSEARRSSTKLIFVGHLTATKRPHVFVQLVAELRRRGLDVVGEMVGDGPLQEDVARVAVDAGVTVLGRRTDVPDLLRAADIFVFTSLPESEGMPGVLIEAGMSGLPILATDCPGVSTVIVPGETGVIVGVHDFESMVSAAEGLVQDRERRRRMGAAASDRCAKEFSLAASATRWIAMLDGLSSGKV